MWWIGMANFGKRKPETGKLGIHATKKLPGEGFKPA
jgi:hypothetical protein